MPDDQLKRYLGDGLYGSYDGYQIRLAANNGINDQDVVFLDSRTLANFEQWVAALKAAHPGRFA